MFVFTWSRFLSFAFTALTLGGLVAGCAVGDPGVAAPVVDYSIASVPADPSGPALNVCIAPDLTGSYSQERRLAGQRLLTRHLDGRFSEGQGELIVYTQLITSWSYPEENSFGVLRLPAIPNPPQEPELNPPPPTSEPNPFGGAVATQEAATATAQADAAESANATAVAEYQDAVGEHERLVTEQQEVLETWLSEFERLDPDQDWVSSDIWGAIARCGERLASHDGTRLMILLSDMVEVERQGRYPELRLDGIRIVALNHECDDPGECAKLREHWTQELTAIGSTSVEFHDAAVSQTLTTEEIFGPLR